MARLVYKYGTGHPIPDGAVYLSTVAQTSVEVSSPNVDAYGVERAQFKDWKPCWLVWHYFLIEDGE